MKSVDFCYWLQGWIETSEPDVISARQTQIIKNHLELVFKYDNKPNHFCHSLNGLFNILGLDTFNETQTQKLKDSLSQTFLNEIDTRYTKEEHQILDMIHHSNETLTIEEIHERLRNRRLNQGKPSEQHNLRGAVAKC